MVRKTTLALGAGLALAAGAVAYNYRTTPQVPYTVLETRGNVEVRRYPTAVVAETTADTEGTAFRRLFRYISGANRAPDGDTTGEEIAMTAPVETSEPVAGAAAVDRGESVSMTAPVETAESDDGVRMAFYLPADYDFDTAPEPTDPSVRLVEIPERTLAVRPFSWWSTDRRVAKFTAELLAELDDEMGFTAVDDPVLLRYDGPGTPPFLRTNEIAVEVRRTATARDADATLEN